MMRQVVFILFYLVDNFLQFFKVESKLKPLMAPLTPYKPVSCCIIEWRAHDQSSS